MNPCHRGRRTVMVCIAVEVLDGEDVARAVGEAIPVPDAHIVAIWDREKGEGNVHPQIFAGYNYLAQKQASR